MGQKIDDFLQIYLGISGVCYMQIMLKACILPMAAVTGLDSKPFIMLIISAFCNGDIRQQMTEAQSFAKFLNNGTL